MSHAVEINGHTLALRLADMEAAGEFAGRFPLSLAMTDHLDNEKFARLPGPLTTDASRPGHITAGDVMLYQHDTVVIFYESFESSYSYTRLGWIEDGEALADLLGPGDVMVRFSATDS